MSYRSRLVAASILLAATSAWAEERVDRLISELANPDPAVREKAFDELVEIGEPARQKLAAAAKSPRPAIAAGAAAAMAKLPWDRPGDSQRVAAALKLYGDADESIRTGILIQLLSEPEAADAPAAVVRVLELEPSSRVAWTVVLGADPDDSDRWQRACRSIDPANASRPLALLRARCEMESDKEGAQKQLHEVLTAARDEIAALDTNVLLSAYGLAVRSELHADAAWLLERFIDTPPGGEDVFRTVEQTHELKTRVAWHRFKDAELRKDDAEMRKLAADLLAADSSDMSIFLDILPTIEKTADAKRIDEFFDRAYARQQARLTEQPDEPVHKNDMAWLLARSGRKLDDAEPLAEAAVQARPDEAAFLDTLAEVKFRLGKIDEAVALEEKALKHQPGDKFMVSQLARFKAALATTQPATAPADR